MSRSLIVFASLMLPALGSADELKADVPTGEKLLREGDGLADKNETTEAVLRYKNAFEHLLPGMRKLPFKEEVKRSVTARGDMKAMLLKELDEEMTPDQFKGMEIGLKAFGLIPRDMDLKDVLVRVYSEEIAAFYDPRTKTMHLIEETEPKKPPGFFARLLGQKQGFDKDENKTVIAHELTHALADQHYDLFKLHEAAKADDDRSLALSALIEGEAFLTMLGASMEDWDGDETRKLPADNLERTFRLMGPLMAGMSGKSLREAPQIIAESMIFPYLQGVVFCAKLTNADDWKALDEAYKAPPLSTEQVLHPEKFRAKPDAPMAIDLGTLEPGEGWREVTRNTMGEFQIGVMLRGRQGQRAAAGWDGDTFAAFAGKDDRLGLVWRSTWDSEDDARQFAQTYWEYRNKKIDPDAPSPETARDSMRRTHEGAIFAIEIKGSDVAIVEGFPPDRTETLIETALAAASVEKTHAPARRHGESARDK